MRANPGGEIDPADVVGRDSLIEGLWRVLARQSLELTAERRIGKSSVIKKMTVEPAPGFLAVYQDLEGVRSRLEFVETVYRHAEAFLSRRKKRADRLHRLLTSLGGVQFRGLKLPRAMAPDWKPLLHAVAEDLQEHLDRTLVFFWDEMPFMLQNIERAEGVEAAREVLDVLRSIRQTCPALRMVYTGSIGLHHVLSDLREAADVAHAPMNDMDRVEVPPLACADAVDLAGRILAGEAIPCARPGETSETLAVEVDGVAYYVHLVLDGLVKAGTEASPDTVRDHVTAKVHDPTDPWNLSHFHRRVEPYYGERGPLALALLDAIAGSEQAVARSMLINIAQAKFEAADSHAVVEMLACLVRDHYVVADAAGAYQIASSVLRRWWNFHRVEGLDG